MRLEATAASATPFPVWAAAVSESPLNLGIVWDAENHLVAVTQGAATLASFTYDGLGRRQQKIAGGVTRTYVSDQNSVIEERVSTGQTLRYVEGPGIDQHLAMQDGGAVTYYVADHLRSVVQETSSAGAVTLARKYDPWGNLLAGGSAAGWSFTGREWDPGTGLAFYRARYYDPKLGRFVSEDPIGLEAGPNVYSYVGGQPITYGDPYGLFAPSPQVIAWAAGAALADGPEPGPGDVVGGLILTGAWIAQGIEASRRARRERQPETEADDPVPTPEPAPPPTSRSIEEPCKPRRGCTCTCRADADDNMPGNIKPGLPLFRIATATASNCAEAAKEAKRAATHALAMKPKHVGCRCAGR